MIHQFDHRANSVRFNPERTHNPYLSEEVSEAQHADPSFLPQTRFWVPGGSVEAKLGEKCRYALAFRDIARSTDVRTMIASIIPPIGAGNKVPLLLPYDSTGDIDTAACLLANLNGISFDFVVRQKIQGTAMNWYIVETAPSHCAR